MGLQENMELWGFRRTWRWGFRGVWSEGVEGEHGAMGLQDNMELRGVSGEHGACGLQENMKIWDFKRTWS